MRKPTKDELWKSIIEDLFEDFMYFAFPEHAPQIDFQKGFVFLDKELNKIYPAAFAKNRRADKLVKVWLKDGTEKWILIHVEVQGYQDDDFDFRVFSMFYRIRDRYGKPVAIYIIYTDDSPNFHPKGFQETCLNTEISLNFPTFKLMENPPESFPAPDNPFAIVMEVAWYELRRNKLSDEHYLEIGKKIVWKMARKGKDRETIYRMMGFIKHYVTFEKSEFYDKLEEEIDTSLKIEKNMGILELLTKYKEENIREVKEETKNNFIRIIELFRKGKSSEDIANELNIPIQEVNDIIKPLL